MDETKRTRAEARDYAELLTRLEEQERAMAEVFDAGRAPPRIAAAPRTAAAPVELELEIDAEVVKWFKALGEVWPDRLNAVLRAYAREAWRRD